MSTGRIIRLCAPLAALILWAVTPAGAVISEPDCVLYGTARVFGEPPAVGASIDVRLVGESEPIAVFVVGSRPDLGSLFELRLPMDSTGARDPGRAREGDGIALYIDGQLAGSAEACARGTARRTDLDPENVAGAPEISIADVAVEEGDSGTVAAVFALSLSHASVQPVEVDWATADGTALAPADYQAGGGTASFAPGATSAQVVVAVVGETDEEPLETFTVGLSNPVNATLRDATGVGSISADDAALVLRISDVEVLEGDDGTGEAVFLVSVEVNGPSGAAVGVDFETADGTAIASADYLAGAGRLIIGTAVDCPGVGAPCGEVRVPIVSGDEREPTEYFFVRLSNPSGAVLGDGEAVGTILDDEKFLLFVERKKDGEEEVVDPGPPPVTRTVDGLGGAAAVVASPDGAHLYASGRLDQAVAVFGRDAASGKLEYVESHRDGEPEGELEVDGLGGVEGLAISPDGAHLYAAGFADDALAVFARDADPGSPAFGSLTFETSVREPGLLDGPLALAVSPDGLHVYAAAFERDALAVFARDADKESGFYGQLTLVGAALNDEDGVSGLRGVTALAVVCELVGAGGAEPPVCDGGGQLYAVSAIDASLTVFDRDAGTGLLTPRQVHTDGYGGVDGLAGAAAVAVSPDGRNVYAAGQFDDAIAVFSRAADPASADHGLLSFVARVKNRVGGVSGLDGVSGLAVASDGSCVYAASQTDSAVTVFARNAITGALGFVETRRDGEPDANGVDDGSGTLRLDGLAGGAAVAVSTGDTGRHVYLAGTGDNGLAVFRKGQGDVTAPDVIQLSSSPNPGEWSNHPEVVIEWQGADDPGGTGMAGYAYLFDTAADTDPGFTQVQPHDPAVSAQSATAALPEGSNHYFHLRACDQAGNCSQPVHRGPFWVDLTAPEAPTGLASSSHSTHLAVAGGGLTDGGTVIRMTWTPAADALSGVDGYDFEFSMSPSWTCGREKEVGLDSGSTSVLSPMLVEGGWWFHICAVDAAGNWSAVISAGRFFVGLHAFAGPNQDVNFRNPIVLGDVPSAVGGTPPYSYDWLIQPPFGAALGSTEANPTIYGDQVGLYRATLVVTDSLGARSALSQAEHLVICPGDVAISGRVVFDPAIEQGSHLLEVDDYEIFFPGDVLFLSGETIVLGNGFAVYEDAVFEAVTDPLLICD